MEDEISYIQTAEDWGRSRFSLTAPADGRASFLGFGGIWRIEFRSPICQCIVLLLNCASFYAAPLLAVRAVRLGRPRVAAPPVVHAVLPGIPPTPPRTPVVPGNLGKRD